MIFNDKDGCLSYLLETKKLAPSAISKKIQEIVRIRQARTEAHWCLTDLNKRINKGDKNKDLKGSGKIKNFASPLIKGEETKKKEDFENAFEYAILRYRLKDQKLDALGSSDGRNDQSAVGISDFGDERRPQKYQDSLKTTMVLNSKIWTSLFS